MRHRINLSPTAKQYAMIQAMSADFGHDSLSQTVMYLVMQCITMRVSTSEVVTNGFPGGNQVVTNRLPVGNVDGISINSSISNNINTNTLISEEGECEGEKLSGVTRRLPGGNHKARTPQVKIPAPEMLALANAIRAKLAEGAAVYADVGKLPTWDANRAGVVLEQAIRIDGIPAEQMLELWDWIIASNFWRRNMLSIANCRKADRNGSPKLLTAWRSWRAALHQPATAQGQGKRSVDLGAQHHENRTLIGGQWIYDEASNPKDEQGHEAF